MQKLYGYDSFHAEMTEVIREGPSGYWVGKIRTWLHKNGKIEGRKESNSQEGDWQPGDILKSTRCSENGNHSNLSN